MGGNYVNNGSVVVFGKKVYVNGRELPDVPAKGHSVTVINNKVYIDGYEFCRGKWRRTLRALYHMIF